MDISTSDLYKQAGQFATANTLRSYIEVAFTITIYFGVLYILFIIYTQGIWLFYIPTCVLAGFIMVKLFTLLHDCSHHSLFRTKRQNHIMGVFLSLFMTMPFTAWKAEHDEHHSHVVDIEKRDHGDVVLYTVEQFNNLPWYQRLGYTIFRHPIFLVLAAPFLYFFLKSRFPGIWTKPVIQSVIWTNIAVACIYLPLVWYFGFWTTVFVFVPAAYLGGIIGIILFYLQHDYPGAEWFRTEDWEHAPASLAGSSLIILPQPLEWFSHAIGYHHIHHLNSRVPGYRLRECYEAVPAFQTVKPLTWTDVMQAFRLKLWSYEKNALVTFDEAKTVRT